MKYIIYSFGFILLLAACKDKTFPPITNNPVFTADVTIGGVNKIFVAGDSSYFMYTNFAKDSNNNSLYTLRGRFGIDTCFTCGPYLEILLNANKNTNGVIEYSMDSTVPGAVINSYSSGGTTTSTQPDTVLFNATNNFSTTNLWTFGDGTTGQGNNVSHVYGAQSYYNFTYQFSPNPSDVLANRVHVSPYFYEPMQVDSTIYPSSVKVVANNCTSCVSLIEWGDNTSSTITGTNSITPHTYNNFGKYTITKTTVQGTDTSISQAIVQFDTLGNVPYDVSPQIVLDIKEGAPIVSQHVNYTSAIINYRTSNAFYSSYKYNNSDQSKKPILTINNITDYELNELNQKTKLIEASVNTYLYNTQNVNDSILINSKTMRFGVAVPK
jgi:hypothetical protein